MNLVLKHSKSKPAWNVVNNTLGQRYKIAVFPYLNSSDYSEEFNNKEMDEQKQMALLFIEMYKNQSNGSKQI